MADPDPDPDPGPGPDPDPASSTDRPTDGRLDPWLLVALSALAVLVAVLLGAAAPHTILDEGWRDVALVAGAIGLGVVGAALAVMVATSSAVPPLHRAVVTVAVVVVGATAVVVLVARDRGDVVASEGEEPTAADETPAPTAPEPVSVGDVLDPDVLIGSSATVAQATPVNVQLNRLGRQLAAQAMRCRPQQLRDALVRGVAVGGTYVEPLVVLRTPVGPDGEGVTCRPALLLLPVEAGIAIPGG